MPTKCSVNGCETFYERSKPFFNLPTEVKYKFAWEKAQLAKKRRKLWLEAMDIQDNEQSNMIRICSKHFLLGKPSALENTTDIDWVPSFNMNLSNAPTDKKHKRTIREKDKGKKDLSKHSISSQSSNSSQRSSSSRRPSALHRPSSSHRSVSQKNTKNNVKKSDLKKLLTCKVLLDGTLRNTTFKGTNGSGLAILQEYGSFTSENVTLRETAVNHTVLRIHLFREDLNDLKRQYKLIQDLKSNKRKRKVEQVSSFGREIKKKRYFYDYIETPAPSNKRSQHVQQSPSVDSKTSQNTNNSFVNSTAQMKKKSEIEGEKPSIHSKLQVKPVVGYSFENNKTLNRTIKKNDKDNIKVKLFPKVSTPVTSVLNGTISKVAPETPLQLHREILFVKQYKNDHLSPKQVPKYYLKFPYHRYHEDGVLNYAFQKLVTDVKHMRLPAPSWKIKVIIRQGKISAITFTNKLALERCVGFFVNSDRYRITIDNRPAALLGSPNSVNDASELEILLDIIQNIESDNPMVYYK